MEEHKLTLFPGSSSYLLIRQVAPLLVGCPGPPSFGRRRHLLDLRVDRHLHLLIMRQLDISSEYILQLNNYYFYSWTRRKARGARREARGVHPTGEKCLVQDKPVTTGDCTIY